MPGLSSTPETMPATGAWPHAGPSHFSDRATLAARRVPAAQAALTACRLCAHECGVNRQAGERGRCGATTTSCVFSAQVEVADELELVPTFALAFGGCDLRCEFCITRTESWNPAAGYRLNARALAAQATEALAQGARTVMFLGGEPTIHLPSVLTLVSALPDHAKLVWKTNAHASAAARALLDGLFDVWLADFKFGNDRCATRLAEAPDYTRVARENLRWAARHSELIVRHLLMPEHVDCCWAPVAAGLAEELPGVKVSLRTGFWPRLQALRNAELRRPVNTAERARALDIARACALNLIP